MKNTGFSEISQERLYYSGTDPWFIEIALTGRCNFNCNYCNRFEAEADLSSIKRFLQSFDRCKHIQVTGGEPTLHPDFMEFMKLFRDKSDKVGLSTNGTFGVENYLTTQADMFSISLDDYNLDELRGRGYRNPGRIIDTIRAIAKERYVNVGMVIDSGNIGRAEDIVNFILSLGVHDVKLSTSTKDQLIPSFSGNYEGYPILNYRINNFREGLQMRGYPAPRCHIASNDVTIVGSAHYPCLVYFREGGGAIGEVSDDLMSERKTWTKTHEPQKDAICAKYCMDFKCEFNAAAEKTL